MQTLLPFRLNQTATNQKPGYPHGPGFLIVQKMASQSDSCDFFGREYDDMNPENVPDPFPPQKTLPESGFDEGRIG